MPRGSHSVDRYLAGRPAPARAALEKARAAVRKAVPEAAEVVSYGILAFKLPAGILLYLAGWKGHVAVYPATAGVLAALGDELAAHRTGKGTLRFPLEGRLPVGLIGRIARVRAREVAERVLARKAAPKGTRKAARGRARPAARKRA